MPARRLFLSMMILLAIAGFGWQTWRTSITDPSGTTTLPYELTPEEIALLNDGDIILRRGPGMVSDMIIKVLNEDHNISHCGIVVGRPDGLWVVHSVSNNVSDQDGMQADRLADFVEQSIPGSIVVTRFRSENDNSGLSRRAVDLLRQKIPFDHHFDLADTTSIYCSELLWRILRDEYGVDVFQEATDAEGKYFGFSNFFDPRWFQVILDHQKE
jgi:hypothetical protein